MSPAFRPSFSARYRKRFFDVHAAFVKSAVQHIEITIQSPRPFAQVVSLAVERIEGIFLNRRSQRLAGYPASLDTAFKRAFLYLKNSLPLCDRHASAIVLKKYVCSSIQTVFRRCRPSHIVWRVGAIVVNSIKLMNLRRSRAHVSPEVCEAVSPPFAHCYAASPIALVIATLRIQATVFHVYPDGISSLHTGTLLPESYSGVSP